MQKTNTTRIVGIGKCKQCEKFKRRHSHTYTGSEQEWVCEKHEQLCNVHPRFIFNKKDGCFLCAREIKSVVKNKRADEVLQWPDSFRRFTFLRG